MHPLVLAYRTTDYVAFAGNREIALRIGQRRASVDHLLVRMHASSAAFITTWNPFSRLPNEGLNQSRQAQLEADLRARGVRYLHGEGRGAAGDWSPEN